MLAVVKEMFSNGIMNLSGTLSRPPQKSVTSIPKYLLGCNNVPLGGIRKWTKCCSGGQSPHPHPLPHRHTRIITHKGGHGKRYKEGTVGCRGRLLWPAAMAHSIWKFRHCSAGRSRLWGALAFSPSTSETFWPQDSFTLLKIIANPKEL